MAKNSASFLGANTPQGFVSFFDELYNPYDNCSAYIIKGGPGTGKSTLMKAIYAECEKRGIATEKIYCSSDPDSLDGLIVPDMAVSIADGTSPHIIEPKFPGACENIINTGNFWDKDKLRQRADEIRSLSLENSLHHRRSAKYLAAAGHIAEENLRLTAKYTDKDKVENFAFRFAQRELPKKKHCAPGKKSKRFISAVTPKGKIFLDKDIRENSYRVIGIEDEFSAVSGSILERIGETAVRNGYDVIFCHCPMKPKMQCEHIIIPEKNLALMTIRSDHNISIEFDRIIHTKRFFYDGINEHSAYLRFNRKLIRELTEESISALKDAKAIHDKLEKIYVDAMDFSALEKHCQSICNYIFSKQ
ncbi:MAG: hypothetical protein J6V06_02530 [Clostridia bacterium]|nr:hypothetical protein [Clostridia bacterium]